MSKPTLLIAMPTHVYDQFAMSDHESVLAAHFSVRRAEPNQLTGDHWKELLVTNPPKAILSGWGTPAIPESLVPPIEMLANVTGTVRSICTRSMIERGLKVTNWGEVTAPSVAEHALLLTLAALRRLTATTLKIHIDHGYHSLREDEGVGLWGRRVGLHGFGLIARQLVALLKPFGCQISSYSAGVPSAFFEQHGVREAESLEALFAQSEVIIEVEALTPKTRHTVSEAMLRSLPPGAAFINVGRGAVVDEAALIRVAQEGKIQFALDVYEAEPLPKDSPLRGLRNVTLTPHVAGPTRDRRPLCGTRAVENLVRYSKGEPLIGAMSPEMYDRST